MRFTVVTVHHECPVEDWTNEIRNCGLGNGTVLKCDECGQDWAVERDRKGMSFIPITRRHRGLLWMFAGTRAYDFVMRHWGIMFEPSWYRR
jgi:hypothetical protein